MPATPSYSYDELLQRRMQQASVLLMPDIYYDAARASWLVFRYEDVMRVVLDTPPSPRSAQPIPTAVLIPLLVAASWGWTRRAIDISVPWLIGTLAPKTFQIGKNSLYLNCQD